MNLGLDLNLNVGLEQKLAPQMIQSLKLLQMTSLELELSIKQELEINPLLEQNEELEQEEEEKAPEEEAKEEKDSEIEVPDLEELRSSAKEDEIDWEKYLDEGFDYGSRQTEELENPDERFERVPVATRSLQDHLLVQLSDRHVAAELKPLVEYLIHMLDDSGYLPSDVPTDVDGDAFTEQSSDPSIREIQEILFRGKNLSSGSRAVREAFHTLQSLDPAGIGARNLHECLLLQMHRSGMKDTLAYRIVSEHFALLAKLKIAAIAKHLDVTPREVQEALKSVGRLEPRPGRLLNDSLETPIVPDLIVEDVDGELVLMLNDRSTPSLKISRAYADLLRKGSHASSEEKKFVREKLNSATWLIRAIEQRKSTMLKVMNAIIESQPDFFRKGPTHLRPLILQDIADKIGMHISTVSRVTNGKYVQTKHGIFELKYFFTAGVTQSDGSEVSAITTKDEIKKLIEVEDSNKPLSDQKIVEILKGKGLDVARRTVAKYRDQMEILPARLRKAY